MHRPTIQPSVRGRSPYWCSQPLSPTRPQRGLYGDGFKPVRDLSTDPQWLGRLAAGDYPHDSTVSGGWIVFEQWRNERDVQVGCVLEDGSYIYGKLASFSTTADESTDRELVLTEPISYRPTGSDETQPYPCSAVCISASRILNIFVTYTAPVTSSPEAAGVGDPDASAER